MKNWFHHVIPNLKPMNFLKPEKMIGVQDVAVVLGSRVLKGGKPSRAILRRITRAIELYHEKQVRNILVTGGVGKYPPSEAEVMRNVAVESGVPENKIIMENTARSTIENARECSKIISRRNWKKVVIVTDQHHLFRAVFLFRIFGVTASTQSSNAPEIFSSRPLSLLFYMKEFAAFAYNIFKLAVMYFSGRLPLLRLR